MTYYYEIIETIPKGKLKFDNKGNITNFKFLDYLTALVEWDKKTGNMPI